MSDLISRQAAIHAVCERECTELEPCKGECEAIWALQDLPPAEKTGKWIPHDCLGQPSIDKDVCSECGTRFYQIAETGCIWNYCPNCGARMECEEE